MSVRVSLKSSINREYLPTDRNSIIYLALEILPPQNIAESDTLPSAICLLIDRSGSMRGKKIAFARAAASQLLDDLKPSDHISLITFSDYAEVLTDFEQVERLDKSAFKNRIERLKAGGNTEMFKGLETACKQLAQPAITGDIPVKRIILLSDGKPTDKVPSRNT